MSSIPFDEAQCKHPLERPVFIVSVLINLVLMGGALLLANASADWLAEYPFLHQHFGKIKLLAIAVVLTPPVLVLTRNLARGSILGNSVRLSPEQLPEIYALLEAHCNKLGIQVPELYLTDRAVPAPGQGFSTWQHNGIALNARFIERKPAKSRDVISFMLARELGRIRLNHTKVWYELMLAYLSKIPYLRNPLSQVQALSRDRYGAYLEPRGLQGLVILASGRRLVSLIRAESYLQNVQSYGGLFPLMSDLMRPEPHISYRVAALVKAGLLDIQSAIVESNTTEVKEKQKDKKKKKKHQEEIETTEQVGSAP